MAKKEAPKDGAAKGLSREVLVQHAARLVRVLRALREMEENVTSDALWQSIQQHWSEKNLLDAIKHFEKSKKLEKFKKLLQPLPQARPDGFFTADGEQWGSYGAISRIIGLSPPTVHSKASQCRKKLGKDPIGHRRTFYSLSDMRRACRKLLENLAGADDKGFILVDSEKWGSRLALAKSIGLSLSTVERHLSGCRRRWGKNASGLPTTFYSLTDIEKACAPLLKKVPEAGRDGFINHGGERWGTLQSLAEVLSIDRSTIQKRLKKPRTLEGKDEYHKPRTFYALTDVRKACSVQLRKVPQAKRDGFFRVAGELWGTPWAFSRRWGPAQRTIEARIKKGRCRQCEGKSVNNLRGIYYALSDVRRICTELLPK